MKYVVLVLFAWLLGTGFLSQGLVHTQTNRFSLITKTLLLKQLKIPLIIYLTVYLISLRFCNLHPLTVLSKPTRRIQKTHPSWLRGIISGASGIIPLRFNQGNRNPTAVYPHYKLILWKSTILLMAEPRISLFQALDNYRFNTGLGETFPLPYEMLPTITASRKRKLS